MIHEDRPWILAIVCDTFLMEALTTRTAVRAMSKQDILNEVMKPIVLKYGILSQGKFGIWI
jgi:hypothetical protein